MEQLVLVPASVYDKSLITQSLAKQELSKYQPAQNPTFKIDPSKKERNEKLFAKQDSLVDKSLSCRRIKISNSQSLLLVGVETGLLL